MQRLRMTQELCRRVGYLRPEAEGYVSYAQYLLQESLFESRMNKGGGIKRRILNYQKIKLKCVPNPLIRRYGQLQHNLIPPPHRFQFLQ